MAIIQLTYLSHALQRTVPVQIILPADKWDAAGNLAANKQYKTLYLLHGFLGSSLDWLSGTRIQRWAEERDLAVVMPSGDNSFYVDRPEALNLYGTFIGEELVEMTRRMFPLSRRREDTFIGGLSMGGFGAIRNGLKYRGTFGAVIGLSSALHLFAAEQGETVPANPFAESLFGPMVRAAQTDKNPWYLAAQLAGEAELPKIYLACGTEDWLLETSRRYQSLMKSCGFDVTYEEGPGGHDWDFWDTQIRKVLDWLPLDSQSKGINSGNVKTE